MSQQNKIDLQSNINTQIPDNTAGAIDAADIRNNMLDMTDSLVFNNGDQTIDGSLTVTGDITGHITTADTASYVEGANVDGAVALATTADTALYVEGANVDGTVESSSYALTASFLEGSVTTADTASYVEGANVDGAVALATTADTASYVNTLNQDVEINGDLDNSGSFNLGIKDMFGTGNLSFSNTPSGEFIYLQAGLSGGVRHNKIGMNSPQGEVFMVSENIVVLRSPEVILSGSVLLEPGYTITGDLTGTASYASVAETLVGSVTTADTASYVEGANVDGAVALATDAYTASYVEGANVDGVVALANIAYGVPVSDTTDNIDLSLMLTLDDGTAILKDQYNSITYNPGTNTLNIAAYTNFTGSVSSQDGFTGSLNGTADTASYVEGANVDGAVALATTADTASYVEGANVDGVVALATTADTASYVDTLNQDVFVTGSLTVNNGTTDSFVTTTNGSIILPLISSGQPAWTGTNGEMIIGDDGAGQDLIWVYINGAWKSSPLN